MSTVGDINAISQLIGEMSTTLKSIQASLGSTRRADPALLKEMKELREAIDRHAEALRKR